MSIGKTPIIYLLVLFLLSTIIRTVDSAGAAQTVVRVGVSDFPPVSTYAPNGGARGLLPDIVQHIAEKENWRLEIVTGSFERNKDALDSGRVDLILFASRHTGKERYALTRKTALSTWAHVFTKGPSGVQSLADLAGLSVGSMAGDPYNRALRDTLRRMNIICSFVEFKNYHDLFEALAETWVDAGVVDRLFATMHAPPAPVEKTSIIFSPIEFKFAATSVRGRELLSVFDYHLEQLQNDPASFYNRYLNDFFGKKRRKDKELRTFKLGFTISLSFLLCSLLAAFFLKRQIRYKNNKLSEHSSLLETEKKRRIRGEMDRNRLAAVIEQSSESIYIYSPERVIQYVNPAFEKMTGYTREEVVGRLPDFLWSSDTSEPILQEMMGAIRAGKTWSGRVVNLRKDTGKILTETRIFPIFDQAGSVTNYVNIKRDVTNVSRLENELRQMQKLESIGTLAGGIAHDFNNILSPILGFTEMTLDSAPPNSEISDNLNEVMKAAQRAKALVEQILAFSRKSEESKKPVKIIQVIEEALTLARASLPATIEIRRDFDSGDPVVLADPVQMHQVMMNLFTNAGHAMRMDGGALTVSTSRESFEAGGEPPQFDLAAGAYCRITVRDTGHGMDPRTISRIFDPYFTTKGTGEGTGIGLSVVHGIIKNHGGGITVDSTLGKGASFSVYLPEIDEDVLEAAERPSRPAEKGFHEKILLVDDEAPIVAMYESALTALDYDVTARTSSVEALRAFRASPDRFELVLTDLTMPNMTGVQLIRKIRSIRPEIPVILCTGFSERITVTAARSIHINAVVKKPVLASELSRTIRRVLTSPPPSRTPAEGMTGKRTGSF